MTRRKQSLCLALSGSLVLATLTGCEQNSPSSSTAPLSSPTEPVIIFVGGQCRVATNTIVCRDESRSEPRGRLVAIDWELFNSSTGLSHGSSPTAPGGEISFTGLTAGTYQVNQTVSAEDRSTQKRTYGSLTVSPPLAW